jgi:hypothetical protein
MKSWIARIIAIGAIALMASACSPQELKSYYDSVGITVTDAQLTSQSADITQFWADQVALHRFDYALGDDALLRLRICESGGNYAAVSATGTYRGAYQFSRSTWNAVAAANFPNYNGMDPAAAPPDVQDAFTRALYLQLGRGPWPVCGLRI